MTNKVKKGDFVEVEYTGTLTDLEMVFDTTNEGIAKKEEIYEPGMTYGPVSICIGEGQILQGLDSSLDGLDIGKEEDIRLSAENAFGKKDAKLIRLIPASVFKKQGINPQKGLQINVDGAIGTIKNVTGGRIIVDFNHPFSGKEVLYKVKINRLVTDNTEKVFSLLELALNQKKDSINVSFDNSTAVIKLKKEFPEELLDTLKERLIKCIESVKDVKWVVSKTKEETKNTEESLVDVTKKSDKESDNSEKKD